MDDRKIYFSGSISAGRGDQHIYLQIIEDLKKYGTVLTEHIGDSALTAAGESVVLPAQEIHDRDLAWLAESDVVVADITIPSIGVGLELGKADEWGKPILCLHRSDSDAYCSPMILGSQRILCHQYDDVAEIDDRLDQFFNKELPTL